jgi:hypothetical protein
LLREYVGQYQRHPEAKASDSQGNPAGPDTVGLLGRLRLRSKPVTPIGKEVDRLNHDGASLEASQPVNYQRDDLDGDIAYLAQFPQEETAREVGLKVRAWRNLVKGISKPRLGTAGRIAQVAAARRESALGENDIQSLRGTTGPRRSV